MSRVLQDRQIDNLLEYKIIKYLRPYCFQDQLENFSPGVCARPGQHEPCNIVITEVIPRQRLSQSLKITWSMIHGPPRSRRFDDFSQTDRNSSRRSSAFGSVSRPGCMDYMNIWCWWPWWSPWAHPDEAREQPCQPMKVVRILQLATLVAPSLLFCPLLPPPQSYCLEVGFVDKSTTNLWSWFNVMNPEKPWRRSVNKNKYRTCKCLARQPNAVAQDSNLFHHFPFFDSLKNTNNAMANRNNLSLTRGRRHRPGLACKHHTSSANLQTIQPDDPMLRLIFQGSLPTFHPLNTPTLHLSR